MTVELRTLRERLTELKEYYRGLRIRWQEDHEYYSGNFKVELPEGCPKRIPASGRNAVDVPKSHLISDKPVVKRRTNSDEKRRSADDDACEAFMTAFLRQNERLAETPPLHEGFKFQLLRGGSIRKGPFFNLAKFERNVKEGRIVEPDYLWYDVTDPWNVFIDPGPRPRQVFFERSITVAELEEKYAGDKGFDQTLLEGKPRSARLILVEWYGFEDSDGKYTTYCAFQGEDSYQTVSNIALTGAQISLPVSEWVIAPRNSRLRYLPARVIYSGYGMRTESGSPEDLWESILNKQVKTLLTDEAAARSRISAFVNRVVWGRFQTDNPDSLNKVKVDPNGATVSFVPRDVIAMPAEAVPPTLFEEEDKIEKKLEQALFSGVVGGQRPKGVDTASGLALLSGTGRLKFGGPLDMQEVGVDELLFDLCLLLEEVVEITGHDTEFEIMGRKLKVRQLHGDYAFTADLLSEDTTEKNQKINTGILLAASPYAPSIETVWQDWFGIEDVAGEFKKKLRGNILLSPEASQIVKDFLGLAKFKVAEEARNQNTPQQSNMDVVKQLNSMATMYRAGNPGGLPQQEPLPNSVADQAVQAQEQVAAGPTGRMNMAPGWA